MFFLCFGFSLNIVITNNWPLKYLHVITSLIASFIACISTACVRSAVVCVTLVREGRTAESP